MLRVGTLAALALLLVPAPSKPPKAPPVALPLSADLRVVVLKGRDIELEVRTTGAADYAAVARRATGRETSAAAIAAWNAGRVPRAGDWVRVPLTLLGDEQRSLVLRRLFPEDRREGGDWIHVARSAILPLYDEGLWQVAEWFTGRGAAFEELLRANDLSSPELTAGQQIRVPAAQLHAALRVRDRSTDGSLEYGEDAQGPFALYRLRPGEALYSAVVVRFTGRTNAEDVRTVAEQITGRNHIPDARDIPMGFEVKIPLDLLEPDFLPAGHPRRQEAEARRAELARALAEQPTPAKSRGLEGVLVIIDPGHGGIDLGTAQNGIWEHDYVYDVACRLKQQLERQTAAKVLLTLMDMETGCAASAHDRLVANRQGTILTSPPFLARQNGESTVGVNLRWYLANSLYARAQREGVDADRVIFLSLHADSRHPALRGLMVYVPGAGFRTGTYGHSSAVYRAFREVREKPNIRFTHADRIRSEAVSRKLAGAIVDSFRREGLPVQTFQPVRDKVIRGRERWLPAVLRSNAVPTKVLVELVNLSNAEDAALLGSARRRDSLARALLAALDRTFGAPENERASR